MSNPRDVGAVLQSIGVDLDSLGLGDENARVVVVRADMDEALRLLSADTRDQVVMTRIGVDTAKALDQWVDAGVAKSRSEAAALFLQEGLRLRQPELDELATALQVLEKARSSLRAKVKRVLGGSPLDPAK